MKKYIFLAASALTLASCSSDDFLGDTQGSTPTSANSAINFSGNAGKVTRATKNTGTAAEMLDGQFKIYGVKKASDDKFKNVFIDYSVWDATANTTTSNTKGWEYVGVKKSTNLGTGKISLGDEDQTIKYWDYSASEYRFVAGSPISAFKFNKNQDIADKGTYITSATISGLAGHIEANKEGTALNTEPVYVATPKVVKKEKYQEPVQFEFNRQQAMVRVGIYETIPGYAITAIKFYAYDNNGALKVTDKNNIILTSGTADYFVGGSNIVGTINYDWTGTTPSYTYAYTEGITKSRNWYAGHFEPHNALATTSTAKVGELYGTDKDMSSANGYFTVLPTPTATTAAPIIIKCDYTLTADDLSGETIEVTGATAAIPAAFSKWEVNTRYTYLFKISQNTNGTTGKPGTDQAGLFPITFNAVVKESTEATPEGTVTTVSTPSITTYQDGSVTDNGIEYKSGKAIYATATNDNGEEYTLTTDGKAVGNVQVYKLSKERNEAELQVSEVVKAEITNDKKITTTVPTTETTVGNVKLAANKYLSFIPNGEGYYAIQYMTTAATAKTPAAYAYKVVYVKAAPSTKE